MAASIEGDAGEKKRPDVLVKGHEDSLLQVGAGRPLGGEVSADPQPRGATRLSGTRTGRTARRCGRTQRWLLCELVPPPPCAKGAA